MSKNGLRPPPRGSGRDGLGDGFLSALKGDWRSLARPSQIPPEDFSVWLFLAGRGSGKNWACSHFVHEQAACGNVKRVALVGATADAVRFTMVEGEAGILAAAGNLQTPEFEAGKGQITWRSGCIARLYSADSPELLRGPEHDLAWCDELAAWRRAQETWDNLSFTMRLGRRPRIVISTTPKPTKLVKDLVSREGKDGIAISRSSTYDNRQNLPASFFANLVKKYEGTRTGRQELLAELLLDTPGALWSAENLEATRVEKAPQTMARVVVAIDPSGSGGEGADEAGIIVAGLGLDSNAYVLADLSGRMSPTEWARRAIDGYRLFGADRIMAEVNFGGQMVLSTVAAVDPSVPTKAITSSRGKVLRAEPVSALFEQSRAHLVGTFPELEDQLASFTSDYDRSKDGSPDRLDAMVFAISELMSGSAPGSYFNTTALMVDGAPAANPSCVGQIFGTLVTTPRTGAAVGFVILATTPTDEPGPRLHIIDWLLGEMDQCLSVEWLSEAYKLLQGHAKGYLVSTNIAPPILVESDDFGGCAFDLALVHFYENGEAEAINLSKIDRRRGVPIPTLDELVEAVRPKINSGVIKLAQPAFERQAAFRSASANHLLTQLRRFAPEERAAPVELVTALCTGIEQWLGAGV
jgi:phage terminase large subunit-like protein